MDPMHLLAALATVLVFNGLGVIHLRWPWLVRRSTRDWGALTGESQKLLGMREVRAYHQRVGWTLEIMGAVLAILIMLG
jgi:hypothetical protein